MTEFQELVGIDTPKANPIPDTPLPEPEKVERKPKVESKPKKVAKTKATPKRKAKPKKKAPTYVVRKKKSVAVKTDTGLGPAFKDEQGNILPCDIDESYVKKLVQESMTLNVPQGVASEDILPQYACYTRLYDIFNAVFFGNELDPVMLVFQDMRGAQGMYKYHSREEVDEKGEKKMVNQGIWSDGKQRLSEISLNPKAHFTQFAEGRGEDAISTVVHEIAHHWEYSSAVASDNKIPKNNYHGKVFAEKMESMGLITTNDGTKDGARTGRTMTHYVAEDGPFQRVYKLLPDSLLWPLKGPQSSKGKQLIPPVISKPKVHRSRNKVKYECPLIHKVSEKGDRACDTVVWSKPDRTNLACMNHGEPVTLKAVNNPE